MTRKLVQRHQTGDHFPTLKIADGFNGLAQQGRKLSLGQPSCFTMLPDFLPNLFAEFHSHGPTLTQVSGTGYWSGFSALNIDVNFLHWQS